MSITKPLSILAGGFAALAVALTPLQASALSTASMTLSGATQTNGSFSAVVYEDTGSDTVTGANVEVSGVSGVSYDYSVGPFTAVTPSGAHNAYGTVTGSNPVARISFTLSNPGTATVSIDGNSYLKHAGDTSVESFAINRGSANFTYTAPSAPSNPSNGGGSSTGAGSSSFAGSTSASSSSTAATTGSTKASTTSTGTSSTPAASGDVKDASTTATTGNGKKATSSAKKTGATTAAAKEDGRNILVWLVPAVIVAAVAAFVVRKQLAARAQAAQNAKDAKADKTNKTAKAKK